MGLLTFILMLIRKCFKRLSRFFTGKCEIERAALANDHRLLERAVANSHVFTLMENTIFSPQYSEDAVNELCALKNIRNQQSREAIGRTVRKVCSILAAVVLVEKARSQKYSSDNPRHQEKLMQLWASLRPNEKLTERNSTQWIDIGFQDANPATDFRGAGYLGLLNILEYSRTAKGQECFRTAMQPATHFFFCSAGLFITLLCTALVKERRADELFAGGGNPEGPFQQLYNNTFNRFHRYFKQLADKSMMSFNTNLKQFERTVRGLAQGELLREV